MKSTYNALQVPRLTVSSVGDLICNKKFHTLRVLKQWPPRQPLSFGAFGTAFHEVLRHVYDPSNAPLPSEDNIDLWVRQAFIRSRYADENARDLDADRCKRMVLGYIQQDDVEDANGTIGVEKFLEHTILDQGKPLVVLAGKLDRLIVRERDLGCLIVRDYKTARPRVDLQEACLQLALARLHYPEFPRLELELDWIDEGGRVDRDVIKTSSVRGIYSSILARVKEVLTASAHPAERNEGCGFCPLRESCAPESNVSLDIAKDIFEGCE